MLKIKCPKHPKYTGATSPRASCEQCQHIEIARNEAELHRCQVVEGKKDASKD